MNWWRTVFGTVGVVVTALGLGLLFVPELVAAGPIEVLIEGIEAVGSDRVFLAVGVGVIVYLGVVFQTAGETAPRKSETHRFEKRQTEPPETAESTDDRLAARELEEDIEAAIEHGGETLAILREQLRVTAASVHADATNTPETASRTAIDIGEWCRDPLPAAFLAGPDGPSHSLEARVRLLLVPRRERRRRIERTITAIETLENG